MTQTHLIMIFVALSFLAPSCAERMSPELLTSVEERSRSLNSSPVYLDPNGNQGIIQPTGTAFGVFTNPSSWVSGWPWVFDPARFITNSLPISVQHHAAFGDALVGGIEIPSSALWSGPGHATGIAGYARSASTNVGAVGVYGQGTPNADLVSAWGANFSFRTARSREVALTLQGKH